MYRISSIIAILFNMIVTWLSSDCSYKSLIKEADGEDYQLKRFNEQRTCHFKFIMITQVPFPPDDLLERVYPISVICT